MWLHSVISIKPGMLCLAVLAIGCAVSAGEPRVEGTASLGAGGNDKSHQRVLIGPMEPGNNIGSGGWPIDETPNPSYMYVDYVRAYSE